jgi:hypothetical protein
MAGLTEITHFNIKKQLTNRTTDELVHQIFSNLDEYRQLPNYQLERRADIFFSIYLKEILEKHLVVEIDSFIPEFPLKIDRTTHSGKSSNLSNKADYFAVCWQSKTIYLIELKTESTSLRISQHEYLVNAKEKGLYSLLNDLCNIGKASRHKAKYTMLFKYLRDLKLIDIHNKPLPENIFKIEIVYIIPSIKKGSNAAPLNVTIITFKDIIECLKHHKDILSQRFIQSLFTWSPESD